MAMQIEPMTRTIGATVSGIDLRKPIDGSERKCIEQALVEHGVLFFRNQPLNPDEMIALAQTLGPIETHPFGRHLESHPLVGLLDQTEPKRDGANRWHTDSTFMPTPPKYVMLGAVQLPPTGGDTNWASMSAAYDALAPPIQRLLEGLTAVHDVTGPLVRAIQGGHSVSGFEEIRKEWPECHHPVICRHPESGRKMLYVNSNFTTRIEGVSDAESDMLLRFLFEWIRTPEIQVRFQWEPDSFVLWDNRSTQHFAVADYSERRIMHRITIEGDWKPDALVPAA